VDLQQGGPERVRRTRGEQWWKLVFEDPFEPACEIGELPWGCGVSAFREFCKQLGEQCGGVDVLVQETESLSQR
jgi:hypothetical protein